MAWIESALGSTEFTLVALPAAFVLGLLAAVASCCTYPAIGAVAGYSAIGSGAKKRDAFVTALAFLGGTFVALVAVGAIAGFVSQSLASAVGRYWKIFAGAAAILFGLAALKLLPFSIPKIGSPEKGGGATGAAVFGCVVGGATTACSVGCNPLLALALGVTVVKGQALWGAMVLAVFAIGHSLPLAAALLGLSLGKSAIRAKAMAGGVRIAGGVILIAAGFYLLATF